MKLHTENKSVADIYTRIVYIVENARKLSIKAVNAAMVQAYWQIGKLIVEYEQKGKERAEYGHFIIQALSLKLTHQYGTGFDRRNLWYMKKFYLY